MKKKGKLIVIDGLDGSGKATQTKLLVQRLKKEKYQVAVTDFPQYYTSFFGKMVGRYLAGEFGKANQVNPYLASILYALDRFEAKEKMKKWLSEGKIVISNRYVSANQIHQTAKIKGKKEKEKFLKWLDQMEYKVFGIPRPNLIIFLNIPFRIGQRLVIKKGTRGYLKGVKRDIHESSKSHLSAAQRQVLDLANKYTKWKKVDCVKGNKLLSKKEISEAVWEIVMKVL
ncbi:MAG: thymidylate kinase [Candidatus Kerfeldbacteria bacterium CG08_land_8_20_14_0_20_40_16]|uniref:Thymidylate kinase n=1 Tax=Candidatus Kerfeldbacteria bacterium CG08_land_8_20_14_0_20_40_16 TaxID=2014244 RepID=A0A2H0YWT5_9BACT|nr:MAG: thymidylate kinase [Candidatus Kerfeldbacteria bacterium CG08_land_8_20_14_0_20_40_16]